MNKEPARLYKSKPQSSFDMGMLLLHPIAIILGLLITALIISALLFAVTGHSVVESGGMRNFLANGV